MYPGRVTRVTEEKVIAANTIRPRTDVVYVEGATPIKNIVPTLSPRSAQLLFIIASGGPVTLSASGGNIYGGGTFTIPQDRAVALLWSRVGANSLSSGWVVASGVTYV